MIPDPTQVALTDNEDIFFGTGSLVNVSYDTSDANANCLFWQLPEGGAVDVPVFAIGAVTGAAMIGTDLGLFNGITQTTLAIVDADNDSYIALDFSADDTPRIRAGGSASYVTFSQTPYVAAFGNTAGYGIDLSGVTTALRAYADDGGSTSITAASRAIWGRTLLTVNAGDCTMDGVLGQVKINLNVHCSADFSAGVRGYLELKGGNTVNTGGANANIGAGGHALRGNISVDANTTIATGHYLCGLHVGLSAASGVSITQTGKLVGVGVFADDQAGGATPTDKWGIGLYVHPKCADVGVQVGDWSAATTGSGITLSGTFTAANRFYADDGEAAIGSGSLIRGGVFRLLQTYTGGNREHEAAGVIGQVVSSEGTNRHNMAGTWGSYEVRTSLTVDGQAAATDTWAQAAIIARVGSQTASIITIASNGVLAGVAAMSNVPTGFASNSGVYAAYYAGAWASAVDWAYGMYLEGGKFTTGIAIGSCTTGITVTSASGYALDIQTTGQFRMGIQGTGIPTATDTAHAVEIHAETNADAILDNPGGSWCGFSAGIRCRYEISKAQTATVGFQAIEGRLRVKAAMAGGLHCGVSGSIEADAAMDFTGVATTQRSAGNFCVELGSTCTFGSTSGWLTGVTIDSSIHATQTGTANITFPALRIKKSSGKLSWQYGVYVETDSSATGIYVGTCSTAAMVLGASGTAAGDVYIYGGLASSYLFWDASEDRFVVQNTFAADGNVSTYEYGQYIGMAFNTAITTGKYIAGLKIAMEGTGNYDSGAQVYPLWIDFQNIGTNSTAHCSHIMLQAQASACLPDCFIKTHVASPGVPHFVKFTQDFLPVSTFTAAGKHGGVTRKISIDIAGTEYFLLASTTPVSQ